MKITIASLIIAISQIILINHANAGDKPKSTIINNNQSAELITKPANINSQWSTSQQINTNLNIKIDHQSQKINMMDYINNLELFFQDHQDQKNNYQRPNYEPVEYLKVPKLDSGITIKVGDF
jgi:hypothetical protein